MFFSFPKQEIMKLQSKRKMNLKILEWNTVHRLCSQHFTEYCFNRTYVPLRLTNDAVPTILIKRTKSVSYLLLKMLILFHFIIKYITFILHVYQSTGPLSSQYT